MNLLGKIFIGWVIFVIIIIAAYFGYKKYIEYKTAQCSNEIFLNDPILYQQAYCFDEIVAGIQAKLDDTNNKLDILKSKQTAASVSSAVDATMQQKISDGITCLGNYKIYLTRMLDKYNNASGPRLRQIIKEKCGGVYPIDKSLAMYPINCKTVLEPWITPEDITEKVECPLFT